MMLAASTGLTRRGAGLAYKAVLPVSKGLTASRPGDACRQMTMMLQRPASSPHNLRQMQDPYNIATVAPTAYGSTVIASAVAAAASTRALQTSARAASKESWAAKGDIAYSEVKKLASEPTGEVTIIDVREPDEVSAGMIPSAVNVPLSQFEKAFNPNGGADFQEKFAFPRPEYSAPVVFYCRSGKRSAQAQEIAQRNGWRNSRNYKGSYLDWVSHEERS